MFIKATNLTLEYTSRKIDANRSWWKEIFNAQYENNRVLDEVELSVDKARITALLGKNGSGKTTLIKTLCGILTPTSGSVEVFGFVPHERSKKYLSQIGAVFGQKRMLWSELTLQENFRITSAIYQIESKDFKRRSDELIQKFDLQDILSRPCKTFSLGQSMRAELANILIYQPRALFLDEPTIGMDIQSQKKFRKMIKEYSIDHECHVILTSHNLKDVVELSDEILFLENKKIQLFDKTNVSRSILEEKIELRLIS